VGDRVMLNSVRVRDGSLNSAYDDKAEFTLAGGKGNGDVPDDVVGGGRRADRADDGAAVDVLKDKAIGGDVLHGLGEGDAEGDVAQCGDILSGGRLAHD